MAKSLPDLESQRAAIQQQIAALGDMRAGSITATRGRCGNPRCHCHQKDDPKHGPSFRLTRKVKGKTVTETFATPVAQRKAEQEVQEYHHFRELSRELLEVNENICQLRPVEETLTPQEKKRRTPSNKKSRAK